MNSVDRIKMLCKERKIPIATLEKELGFSNGYIAGAKKDLPADRLFACADFFNVGARWLVFGEEDISVHNTAILMQYSQLDDKGKDAVNYTIRNELDRIETLKNKLTNIIPLQKSRQKVSAGRGIYLGPEDMEGMLVVRNEYTAKTAFVVEVSGDSMEPDYHDGDLLLIGRADDVPIGKIGVFTIDGCGYVKQRGEDCLISLNENYDPIPLNESVKCNGYVIGKLNAQWII